MTPTIRYANPIAGHSRFIFCPLGNVWFIIQTSSWWFIRGIYQVNRYLLIW